MDCHSCLSLSGEKKISPAPPIYDGSYWIVEHAYPTLLAGWLVILLKRHAEALHELTLTEFHDLAAIQYKLVQIMSSSPHIQKEYLFCTSEGQGFQHLHIHLVPRPTNLPSPLLGASIFQLLRASPAESISPDQIIMISQQYREHFSKLA